MSEKQEDGTGVEVRGLLDRLKTERDQLELRMHLAKAELRDEWQQMESRFKHFERRARAAGGAAEESGPAVGAALKQLGEELAQAYRRVRNALD